MSPWLLIAITGAYAWVGIEQACQGNWNWAGIWLSYALANLFFYRMI